MNTYWQQYKINNPYKAGEIESLGFNFINLPDKEVREKIFSLETTAKDSKCSISELKEKWFELVKRDVDESGYIYLMEGYDKFAESEAKKYNIEKYNTIGAIFEAWILEKVKEVETRYAYMPPRTSKNPQNLLLTFNHEDKNEYSILRKMHIYTKNYPFTPRNKSYVKEIEEIFDSIFDAELLPFSRNEQNKRNPSLYNASLHGLAFMKYDKLLKREDKDELIKECNDHDVSFYTELSLAEDRIISKYSI